jgi:hypothetical protein
MSMQFAPAASHRRQRCSTVADGLGFQTASVPERVLPTAALPAICGRLSASAQGPSEVIFSCQAEQPAPSVISITMTVKVAPAPMPNEYVPLAPCPR